MSDDIAIRVKGLGKKYRIAHETAPYKTLGETVTNAVKAPFRRLTGEAPARTTEEFWALKDVSFEVKRGEVVGIIGRNGAGKSTLLKILSRITTPTEGTVEVHGRIGSLLEVGTGFHPELSGRENIYLSGSILGMKRSEIDAKFDEIVKFAEMEKFLDTPVKRYSSGMYVRLAFAVAAHLEPEILLIDEVLAVGDLAFQKKCLGKMGDVAKEGRTVLFVSHNMAAVKSLCTHTIYLKMGRIVSYGKTDNIIQDYMAETNRNSPSRTIMYSSDDTSPMRLKSVELVSADDPDAIENSEQLSFRISLVTRNIIEGSYVSINIYDSLGTWIYWSADIDSERFNNPTRGTATLSCTCPEYLLTPGTYSIYFSIFCVGRGVIHHEEDKFITVKITDTESWLASHGISQPGMTAVKSTWRSDVAI